MNVGGQCVNQIEQYKLTLIVPFEDSLNKLLQVMQEGAVMLGVSSMLQS